MEKVRKSSGLKIACYIVIPILVAITILNIFHMAFLSEFGNKKEETKYSQTENFANNYLYFFINKISYCSSSMRENHFEELKDEQGNFYCYYDKQNKYYYNGRSFTNYIQYIIVERESKKIFTNIKSNNYQDVMENVKSNNIYWNLINGKIETNLTYINQDNIKYNYSFNHSNDSENKMTETKSFKDYDIYSFYEEDNASVANDLLLNENLYDFMLQHQQLPIYSCIFSVIILVVIAFYLFWAIGYQKGEKEIYLNTVDRIPYEIISSVCFLTVIFSLEMLIQGMNTYFQYMSILLLIVFYFIGYTACAVWGITTIKRIKAKNFLKSFLLYKGIKWFYQKVKNFGSQLTEKTPESKKIFWYYWGFIAISIILACFMRSTMSIIILILFWIWIFCKIKKYKKQENKIKQALEKIYKGDNEVFLNDNELEGVLKEIAIYINDIAGGFSNAIEESLKSERLKTELITNVSHDIKTPLTSIISYVDLLKKEDLQNEKVKEYVEILDKKSQRLKKLTEDLLEASKVSSGNVKLNIEEIKLKELIYQSIGEFKDRFEEKKLMIETDMPEEEISIKADNRYLYRVIENLFSNVTKYALENSRVYIDVKKERTKIEVSIKNISKEKLNISSDELMQRFVRGDKARFTEGSGLGLSIAKSLTELQGGKFTIYIDGDLFKVNLQWE